MAILSPAGGDGEARRDAAMNLFRVRRAELIRECTAAALRVALDWGDVCADDVPANVPIPAGLSPKPVGVVFHDLADAALLRRAEFRNSGRPAAHARCLAIWQVRDRTAAVDQLAALAQPTT